MDALLDKNRRVLNRKNRVGERIEERVCELAVENAALGQVRVSNKLRQEGLSIPPEGLPLVWLRHQLQTFKLRLKALEVKVAEEGVVLIEAQVVVLECKQEGDRPSGEVETAHSGYFGSPDAFYVGTLVGVGRVYQQTFVGTFSKVACC